MVKARKQRLDVIMEGASASQLADAEVDMDERHISDVDESLNDRTKHGICDGGSLGLQAINELAGGDPRAEI